MRRIVLLLIATVSLSLISFNSQAQCDTIATVCAQHFSQDYLSDGQEYRALLLDDQTAEFHLTLYGGSIYRFGACSGLDDGNLLFRLYDDQRNEIFSNRNHELAPYWDFEIESTLDVIVEANLNPQKASSGCAVLLVGFKP
ncbi:MAG: hypothetical protein CMP59_07605 [Flavobacteriales bacterium]|nr:hypothetical protein [Flavobacteriales bacterium]|tara:strand:+ start:571 stop:993 length:423 start_codon:yes stop_codon:yes gene_type:complete